MDDLSAGLKFRSDAEIAADTVEIPVADTTKTLGDVSSMSKLDILTLLKLMGVANLDPRDPALTLEIARSKFRRALWDVQRLDYAFQGKIYGGSDMLNPDSLPSWPSWKEKRAVPGIDRESILNSKPGTTKQFDVLQDGDAMDTWVMRHFQMSSFTQPEIMQGVNVNPPAGLTGSWVGAKRAMGSIAEQITLEGGKNVPFFTYSHTAGPEDAPTKSNLLIAQIIDVKQPAWPDPSPKEWEWIRAQQQKKFGHDASGPLVPMLRTPKMPMIVVRYAYTKGRPKDGLRFGAYLQEQLEKAGLSPIKARERLHYHIKVSAPFPELHL